MNVVCLDTHILIWAIKEEATPGQEEMIEKAKLFIKKLDEQKIRIAIPAIVYTEILLPVPEEKYEDISNELSKNFIIAPYDAIAGQAYTRIWKAKQNDKTIDELSKTTKKNELKVDCQIVATAVSKKYLCIYSHDKDLQKFAKGFIEVKEIPDMQEQLTFHSLL